MARRKYFRRHGYKFEITTYGDDFIKIVTQYGEEALFEAGKVVLDEAKRRAPKRTGKLLRSGYVVTRSHRTAIYRKPYWRREKEPRAGEAIVAFTAPHAHLMESGRRRRGVITPVRKQALKINGQIRARSRYNRMSSRPFVGPALESTKDAMARELAGVLRRRLEEKLGR